jgi:hypothetical protein
MDTATCPTTTTIGTLLFNSNNKEAFHLLEGKLYRAGIRE